MTNERRRDYATLRWRIARGPRRLASHSSSAALFKRIARGESRDTHHSGIVPRRMASRTAPALGYARYSAAWSVVSSLVTPQPQPERGCEDRRSAHARRASRIRATDYGFHPALHA